MFSGLTFALLRFTGELLCGLMPMLHELNYCICFVCYFMGPWIHTEVKDIGRGHKQPL